MNRPTPRKKQLAIAIATVCAVVVLAFLLWPQKLCSLYSPAPLGGYNLISSALKLFCRKPALLNWG